MTTASRRSTSRNALVQEPEAEAGNSESSSSEQQEQIKRKKAAPRRKSAVNKKRPIIKAGQSADKNPDSLSNEAASAISDSALSGDEMRPTVESEIIPSLMSLLGSRGDYGTNFSQEATRPNRQDNPQDNDALPDGFQLESGQQMLREFQDYNKSDTAPPAGYSEYSLITNETLEERASFPDAAQFAAMVLDEDENLALRLVFKLRSQGIKDEEILTHLLAPTSVALGKLWEDDLRDFADVTIGVCRLHRILRWLHPQNDRNIQRSAHGGRIALAPVPGEQHSFGLLLAGDLLYRNGWYTDIDIDTDSWRLPATVSNNWYELIGLSLSCESRIDLARDTISALRRASCNTSVKILIGGRLLTEQPEVAQLVGADDTAADAQALIEVAEKYSPAATTRLLT